MRPQPLDLDQVKIFTASFGAVTEEFFGIPPGARRVLTSQAIGKRGQVLIKAVAGGDVTGKIYLWFDETTACVSAEALHEKLRGQHRSISRVNELVNKLLEEFAAILLNRATEQFKADQDLSWSVQAPEVVDPSQENTVSQSFVQVQFPLGGTAGMELFLDLQAIMKLDNIIASGKKRIMVVDDSPNTPKLIESVIKGTDCIVVGSSTTGKDIADKIKSTLPDLIFLNVDLPTINGIEVLSGIKASHPRIRTIAILGMADKFRIVECIRRGAVNCLLKPFQTTSILEAIKKAIS